MRLTEEERELIEEIRRENLKREGIEILIKYLKMLSNTLLERNIFDRVENEKIPIVDSFDIRRL